MNNYRPMLGSNEPFNLSEIQYPVAVTIKRDGIRAEFINHELLSRELKPIANKQVQELAEPLKEYGFILNSEFYIHTIPFNEHSIFTMTHDLSSREHSNKIKAMLRKEGLTNNYYYYLKLPNNAKFYIFDTDKDLGYCDRINWLCTQLPLDNPSFEIVDYLLCYNQTEVEEYFDRIIEEDYEGLVLRKPDGKYKHGRATKREQTFLKLKPILNLQATCIGFTERLANTNISFINEVGLLEKRNTVDNKENTGIAATIIADYMGNELKITLTGTEEYRRYIFENQNEFINKQIQFKGMLYGSKKLPRHPVFLKFL